MDAFDIEKPNDKKLSELFARKLREICENKDLFGKVYPSKSMKSIMPEGTPYFEVEELYVVPKKRSQGIGEKLFKYAENAVKDEAEYMVLSTATKNWKAIFHFYIDELDMTFWSARLFKKIGAD